ncbi:hypothetical protein BDV18DRAFT_146022 [Aspergillus unguis]
MITEMYSLRRAACRLLTTAPSQIVRSRLKPIPRARLSSPPQRTFAQSRWCNYEGKSPLDSNDTNATPTPTPASTSTPTPTETPTSTTTTAETSTEARQTITTSTTEDARDESVGVHVGIQAESVQEEFLKKDLEENGSEANGTETIATDTATKSSVTTQLVTEAAEPQEESSRNSDSIDTTFSATSNEVSTNPSIAIEADLETTPTSAGEGVGQDQSANEFDLDQIREAAVEEEKIVAEAKALEAERLRSEKLDMLRQARYIPNETVFIGNLFYDVTAEDLKAQMIKYGVVQAVNIIYDSRGISKGYGYVQFDSKDAAQRAIDAMHMRIFEGRRVTMYFAQTRVAKKWKRSSPTNTLYIGNMPYEMTDRDINDLVKDVSGLIDVRVTVDRESGQLRGYFHAEFIDVASAEIAFEKISNKKPYGRRLRVDFSNNIQAAQTAFPPSAW